jgi:hypothetical protein
MVKHPALTAAAGGGAVAATELQGHSEKLEAEIMRNRLGSPGGKFVYSELDEFASRKKYLAEKTAFLKTSEERSFDPARSVGEGFMSGAGGETAKQLIQGVAGGVGRAARGIKNKVVLEPKREQLLRELLEEDPVIADYEKESPGTAEKAYSSMRRFAPELSTDPNVVASYLREAAQTGGAANYMTIKQLAETEAAINKAQGRG